MLSPALPRHRSAGLVLVAVLVTAVGSLLAVSPAAADPVKVCDQYGNCEWVIGTPGDPGNGGPGPGGGGGGAPRCEWQGQWIPCTQPGWGWFNNADGCYYVAEQPPPPAGDPAWEGHAPGDGGVYRQRCFGDLVGVLVWRATPPPGAGTVDPAVLAARAIAAMKLQPPPIGIAPDPNGSGLVGLPVWLWVTAAPNTWGPITASASVPGLTVTARAQARHIVWAMGEGGSVTCTNPGTAYKAEYGNTDSPTCGYRYQRPSSTGSNPAGRYTVTATTTWDVNWNVVGGGATGTQTLTLSSQTTVRIGELQVVGGGR